MDEALLKTMVNRIVDAVAPERIVLFGSHARGDARADSDVDLLVIASETFGPGLSRFQAYTALENAMGMIPVATDFLLFSHDEVDRLTGSATHVVAHALREGRVVYVRS
ncbi:MAG: nucleotidyltransferase domain-containing protein [Magnetococcales bacterium]|nr:nucleotidyltransferase domain-containing protein [Magnetococcales bacterium]